MFFQDLWEGISLLTALLAGQILTPIDRIEEGAVCMEGGIIAAVGSRADMTLPSAARVVDLGDVVLTPGLIDLHIHGAASHDVMEGDEAAFAAIESFIASHGVTSYCPTTVTAPVDRTLRSLEALRDRIERSDDRHSGQQRAQPLGVHCEGPFLSHARRGVHPPAQLQPASVELFDRLWQAAGGRVCILTMAPELEGAPALIAEAAKRGVCVSLGHSDAHFNEASAGIDAGARHATHTFNAMRPLRHRDPGLLGALLTDSRVTADIIVDGIHVDPVVIKIFVRTKGIDGVVLITDAISATGMPDGVYRLGEFEVTVQKGRCESNGALAGSVLTLDRAVCNMARFADLSFQSSLCMATLNPARTLGLSGRKGSIQVGADADMTVFSRSGEVLKTIIGGVVA